MATIIGVGFSIPSKEDDYIAFDSKGSLSDADIAIFDANYNNITSYRTDYSNGTFQGKLLYSTDSSFKLKEHLFHWNQEIQSFLKAGKTIFIILTEKHEFFVHTGQKNTSGTGRNQRSADIVDEYDNYKFLPSSNFKIFNASGSKIYPYSMTIQNIYECCKDYFKFEAYVDIGQEIKSPLLATKNKDKILSVSVNLMGGHVVFIPAIEFPEKFELQNGSWSKEALTFGSRFKACLTQYVQSLGNSSEKSISPEWVDDPAFNLDNSMETKESIEKTSIKIQNLEKEVQRLNKILQEQESLKDLLFESGKPLELSVIKALKILGYNAENYNDGVLELDQVIVSPEGDRYIGECEGKESRDIDITKFRQLSDSLNEDLAREEVQDKAYGILFGNPQRFTIPNKRNLDFTDKCKRAAQREHIALIKTSDLFEIAKYLTKNNDENFKSKCRVAIKSGLGGIIKFPSIPTIHDSP